MSLYHFHKMSSCKYIHKMAIFWKSLASLSTRIITDWTNALFFLSRRKYAIRATCFQVRKKFPYKINRVLV